MQRLSDLINEFISELIGEERKIDKVNLLEFDKKIASMIHIFDQKLPFPTRPDCADAHIKNANPKKPEWLECPYCYAYIKNLELVHSTHFSNYVFLEKVEKNLLQNNCRQEYYKVHSVKERLKPLYEEARQFFISIRVRKVRE